MSSGDEFLNKDPMEVFKTWVQEASTNSPLNEPLAMALATVSNTGEIHNRIVLLKKVTDEGLVFFTNYNSSKGTDLEANPQTEAVFYWDHLLRQVRIGGRVEKTSREVSENYWKTRPRESQLSQWVSHQSGPVKDRRTLEEQVQQARKSFEGKDIPCPSHWGGYILRPDRIELWIGSPGRLHDRFHFRKDASGWTSRRLYP